MGKAKNSEIYGKAIKGVVRMKKKITEYFICAVCIVMLISDTVSASSGKTPESLRNTDIEYLVSQLKFDAREYGIITPVRDQGDTSLCWAYSTASASEASIIRSGIDKNVSARTAFLSPHQIGFARHNRGADPLGNTNGEKTNEAGNWKYAGSGTKYAAALLSEWCGPVKSGIADDANGWENAAYRLESAISVDGRRLDADKAAREKMKRAIVKYGAVTFSYNNMRQTYYYNPNGEKGSSPHACTVIGWDDTIPADSFYPGKTTTDGGWLVKNSYSSLPYFYLSYEVTCEQIYAFDYVMNDKYDNNYFYDASVSDIGAGSLLQIKQAANVFTAKGGSDNTTEQIKAVSVNTVGENTECTVEIYTDVTETQDGYFDPQTATLAATKTTYFEYGGFNCIELDDPVEIKQGSNFAAVVKVTNAYITMSENDGKSYWYRSGWSASPVAVRIKVFTKNIKKEKSAVSFADEKTVNLSGTSGKKQLILARYENEQLSDVRIVSVDFDNGKEQTVTVPAEWKKENNIRFKAFLWNSLPEMLPECPAAEL